MKLVRRDVIKARCCSCKVIKLSNYFYRRKDRKYSLTSRCKKCLYKHEKNKPYHERYHAKIKSMIVNNYSKDSSCKCCGETELKFLSLDHIKGGGSEHRRSIGLVGQQFYRWIIKNNFPSGYQVLCYNCNMAKGFYGNCPHDKVSS